MTKDTVPQNYTLALALFDALPVILFGLASWLFWQMCGNILVLIGGILCFAAGMLKVLWKIIVVVKKKNIWLLFVQMRIGMPAGFTLMLIGFLAACITKDMGPFWKALCHPLPILFLILTALGMAAMIVCSSRLDPADAKANWIEQGCNTVAQGAFLAAMLMIKSLI